MQVRKATANKLYEALVTYDEIVPEESLDEITTILSEFTWWVSWAANEADDNLSPQ